MRYIALRLGSVLPRRSPAFHVGYGFGLGCRVYSGPTTFAFPQDDLGAGVIHEAVYRELNSPTLGYIGRMKT